MENDIKKAWQEATVISNGRDDMNTIIYNRRQTALQRLGRRYHRFANFALVCLLWIPFMFYSSVFEFPSSGIKLAICIYTAIYFLICSVMDHWLWHGIRGIDVQTMPVAEVLRLAVFYKKRHLQFVAILLPMAMIFLGMFVYAANHDIYMIYGIVFGAVFGLAIGTRQLFMFLSDYRDILK